MEPRADSCEGVDELLLDYAYGELGGSALRRVEGHLERCAACRAALEQVADTRRAMAALAPEPAPSAGLDSLFAYAEQAAGRARAAPAGRAWRRWLAPALSVGGLCAVLLLVVRQPHPAQVLLPAAAPEPDGRRAASKVASTAAAPPASAPADALQKEEAKAAAPLAEAAPAPAPPAVAGAVERSPASDDASAGAGAKDAFGDRKQRMAENAHQKVAASPGVAGGPARRLDASSGGGGRALAGGAMARPEGSLAQAARGADLDAESEKAKGRAAKKGAPAAVSRDEAATLADEPAAGEAGVVVGELDKGLATRAPAQGASPAVHAEPPGEQRELKADAPRPALLEPPRPAEAARWRESAPAKRTLGAFSEVRPEAPPPPPPAALRADPAAQPASDPLGEARAAAARGDHAGAIQRLLDAREGLRGRRGEPEALLLLAREQEAAGLPDAALGTLRELLARHPADPRAPQALLRRIQLLEGQRRLDQASAEREELLRRYPASAQARSLAAEPGAAGSLRGASKAASEAGAAGSKDPSEAR